MPQGLKELGPPLVPEGLYAARVSKVVENDMFVSFDFEITRPAEFAGGTAGIAYLNTLPPHSGLYKLVREALFAGEDFGESYPVNLQDLEGHEVGIWVEVFETYPGCYINSAEEYFALEK